MTKPGVICSPRVRWSLINRRRSCSFSDGIRYRGETGVNGVKGVKGADVVSIGGTAKLEDWEPVAWKESLRIKGGGFRLIRLVRGVVETQIAGGEQYDDCDDDWYFFGEKNPELYSDGELYSGGEGVRSRKDGDSGRRPRYDSDIR